MVNAREAWENEMREQKEQWEQQMRDDKDQWEVEKEETMAKARNSEQVIKINIGGVKKELSRELVTSVEGSLMEKTFSGNCTLKTVDQHVFLDRDPRIFEMVLNFLRHDGNYMPEFSNDETKQLFEMELKYWGVSELRIISKLNNFLK